MKPINMLLYCPHCFNQHIDYPSENWKNPPHRTHKCSFCGHTWRVADVPTRGVAKIRTKGHTPLGTADPGFTFMSLSRQLEEAKKSVKFHSDGHIAAEESAKRLSAQVRELTDLAEELRKKLQVQTRLASSSMPASPNRAYTQEYPRG